MTRKQTTPVPAEWIEYADECRRINGLSDWEIAIEYVPEPDANDDDAMGKTELVPERKSALVILFPHHSPQDDIWHTIAHEILHIRLWRYWQLACTSLPNEADMTIMEQDVDALATAYRLTHKPKRRKRTDAKPQG